MTPFGEHLYEYDKNIVKSAEMVQELAQNALYQKLKIASYPSNMIARHLADFYMEKKDGNVITYGENKQKMNQKENV